MHMGTHLWNDNSGSLRRRNSSADPDQPSLKRHAGDRESTSSQPLPLQMNPTTFNGPATGAPMGNFYPGLSSFNEMQRKILDSYSSAGMPPNPLFFPYAAMFNGMNGKMGIGNAAANFYAAQAAMSGLGQNGYFGMNGAVPGFEMSSMAKRINDGQSGDSSGSRSPRSSDTPESHQSGDSGPEPEATPAPATGEISGATGSVGAQK